MTTKVLEIRDRGTFIPMLAIRLSPGNEADRYLLARAGYGLTSDAQRKYVLLARIEGGDGEIHCGTHGWPSDARTVPMAHRWLADHFDEIESGAVVDVQFILGETSKPKESEACDERPQRTLSPETEAILARMRRDQRHGRYYVPPTGGRGADGQPATWPGPKPNQDEP